MTRALIVVDVQNDFCEGGSLPVTGGARVAADIGALLGSWLRKAPEDRHCQYVVATKDSHVSPGDHWAAKPDYAESWPVHCKVGTEGEAFHPNLDPQPFDAVFHKGAHSAAYSGFEGVDPDGTDLAAWLRDRGVTDVLITGIATDHCVRATALDAVRNGFATTVRTDLCVGVAPETTQRALAEMAEAGITLAQP